MQAYCRKMHGTDKDLAAHFTTIHKTGYALTGAPIEEIYREAPRRAYPDSILRDIDGEEREILKDPVYFLLNMCRVAAYAEEGLVLSKKRGGKWGTEKSNPPPTRRFFARLWSPIAGRNASLSTSGN